jgi:hypothetical protein
MSDKVVVISASINSKGELILTEVIESANRIEVNRVKAEDYKRYKQYK